MVGNKLEQQIIDVFQNNPTVLYSINEIAKLLGKAYPYIYKKVLSLLNEGILKKVIVGHAFLCSLNLDSDKTILLLSYNQVQNKSKLYDLVSEEKYIDLAKNVNTIFLFKNILYVVTDSKIKLKRLHNFIVKTLSRDQVDMVIMDNYDSLGDITVLQGYEAFYGILRENASEIILRHHKLVQ